MQDVLWTYGPAVVAVFVTGVSKSGFGGLAMLAVPLMSLSMSPLRAAGVMLPILILMDALSLYAHRGKWRLPELRPLLGGAVLGIGAGALGAEVLTADMARVIVGVIALGFVIWARVKAARPTPPEATAGRATWAGVPWGALAGYTSFVAHAGGPPAQAFLLGRGLDKAAFTATSVAFFAVVNLLKLPAYLGTDLITEDTLWDAARLAPIAPVGVWVGVLLNGRLDPKWFFRIIHVFLVLVGCKLLYQGIGGLLGPG